RRDPDSAILRARWCAIWFTRLWSDVSCPGSAVRYCAPHCVRDTLFSTNRRAAIDHHGLAGHEVAGLRTQEHGRARDLVGDADAQERRARGRGLEILRVVPQRLGKIGLDQAGRDAVHADVVRAVLAGELAAELDVGGLRV